MSWPDAANLGVREERGVVSMQDSIGGRSFIVWGFRTGLGFVSPFRVCLKLLQFSRIRGLDGENHVPGAPVDEFGMEQVT